MNTHTFYNLGLLGERDIFYPLQSGENRVSITIKNLKSYLPELTLDKLLIKKDDLNFTGIFYNLYPPEANGGPSHSTVESFYSFNKTIYNRRNGNVVKFEIIDNDLIVHLLQSDTSNLRIYDIRINIHLLDCPNILKLKGKSFTLSNTSGNYQILGNKQFFNYKVYNTTNSYTLGFNINSVRNGIHLTKSDNSEFYVKDSISKKFVITIND